MGPERAQRRRVATLNLITIRREAAKNFSNTFQQTTMRRYQCRRLPRASLVFGPFPVMSVVVDASAKFRYFWCLLFRDRALSRWDNRVKVVVIDITGVQAAMRERCCGGGNACATWSHSGV